MHSILVPATSALAADLRPGSAHPDCVGSVGICPARGQRFLRWLPYDEGLNITLPSGEVLPLTMDLPAYQDSVHGRAGLTCVSCHTNISGYPHPKVTAGDRRSFQMERYTQCQTCHPEQYQETLDSNHARALAGGNRNAAICTDCHGSHNVSNPN